jgi:hypothetical protein
LDSKYIYIESGAGTYVDNSGDALEFIDLTRLDVAVDSDRISLKISLAHIPEWLVFDRADVSDRAVEYSWAVYFDVDGDGTTANDIAIAVSSFKFKGDEVSIGRLAGFTQRNVWQFGSERSTSLSNDIDVSLADRSTVVMEVSKDRHEALSRITEKTPIRFSTLFNFGDGVCEDFYPDIHKQ